MLALITIRNTHMLGKLLGEEGGTYCVCLQMPGPDHQEHITGRQKLARMERSTFYRAVLKSLG